MEDPSLHDATIWLQLKAPILLPTVPIHAHQNEHIGVALVAVLDKGHGSSFFERLTWHVNLVGANLDQKEGLSRDTLAPAQLLREMVTVHVEDELS